LSPAGNDVPLHAGWQPWPGADFLLGAEVSAPVPGDISVRIRRYLRPCPAISASMPGIRPDRLLGNFFTVCW